MNRLIFSLFLASFLLLVWTPAHAGGEPDEFIRGDSNFDGDRDISNAIYVLRYLFIGGPAPLCDPIADANGGNGTDIADAVFILRFLFAGVGSFPPITPEEDFICGQQLELRRGEKLFSAPVRLGNFLSCSHCHGTEPAGPPPEKGILRVAHGLGDAVNRPSFFNGRVDDIEDAINECRRDWLDAPNLSSEDYAYLLAYLRSLADSEDPAPPLSFSIVNADAACTDTGDTENGCELFARACTTCHGDKGQGLLGITSPLWQIPYDGEMLRDHIRLSGPTPATVPGTAYEGLLGNSMPFWSAERLSNAQVDSIVSWMLLAQDPQNRNCAPVLLREGRFRTRMHGVRGRVQHWSDRTIRILGFFYDGGGPLEVLAWAYLDDGELDLNDGSHGDDILGGTRVSPHLARPQPYVSASLTYEIPPELDNCSFDTVSLWCTKFQLNYGEAKLSE